MGSAGPGEVLAESAAPAGLFRFPAERCLSVSVADARQLGHQVYGVRPGGKPAEPSRHLAGMRGAEDSGVGGEPVGDGRGLRIDDVEHAFCAMLDGRERGAGRVVDMDE